MIEPMQNPSKEFKKEMKKYSSLLTRYRGAIIKYLRGEIAEDELTRLREKVIEVDEKFELAIIVEANRLDVRKIGGPYDNGQKDLFKEDKE